ncbi:TrkA C-terminal domain-containing protein [Planctomycetota bacterium]
MIAIILLIVTLVLSLTITRVGAIASMLTGVSGESARFQARSAFSGVGFTTSESELVMGHWKRRIVMLLMLFGNVGIVTAMAAHMVSLIGTSQSEHWGRNLALLIGGLAVLWAATTSRWLDRFMSRLVARALHRWTSLDVRDYVGLLNLAKGYAVLELQVQTGDWLADKTLAELDLPHEGVLVLGIQRSDATYIGAPVGSTRVCEEDTLIVYGTISRLEELDQRRAGRAGVEAHLAAVTEQDQRIEEEEAIDPEALASTNEDRELE